MLVDWQDLEWLDVRAFEKVWKVMKPGFSADDGDRGWLVPPLKVMSLMAPTNEIDSGRAIDTILEKTWSASTGSGHDVFMRRWEFAHSESEK